MSSPFPYLLRGRYSFLEPTLEEMRRLFPEGRRMLPTPYPIYLEDETATPMYGFPVVVSDKLGLLREALDQFIEAQEEAQLHALKRQPFPRTAFNAAWERYRSLLTQAVENASLASYGRRFAATLWLYHSLDVARRLKDSPRRLLRADLEIGRRHGDRIKYRVYENYVDRTRTAILDVLHRLPATLEEIDDEGFSKLLVRTFDNVLLLTEDHVSRDLAELSSYFSGCLQIDPRDLRQRLARLGEWHERQIGEDWELRSVATHLLGVGPDFTPRELLHRPGYVSFLAALERYEPSTLLSPALVQMWEDLLIKLKEFELLNALRSLMLPVRREGDALVFRAGGLDRTWVGQRFIHLSASTRPLDFMSPSVVDPVVHRYGLIYDISDFSHAVSMLHRAGTDSQEQAFRMMFRFQRRINRLAGSYRLQLEKYMGDGAFYTSRHPHLTLVCAVHLQRLYRRAIEEGLPFDRGLRIGLNFGRYRLFPIQIGEEDEPDRYEFFGHGVVELSRLTSGKASQEIEEIKNVLMNYGYPRQTVLRFFEPLAERNLDVVDKEEESRTFYAYINHNGNLVNEGIVATEEYIVELAGKLPVRHLYRGRQGRRQYVVVPLQDNDGPLYVGLRRLGVAHLKGLEDLTVFEVVDGGDLDEASFEEIDQDRLLPALERQAAAGLEQRAVEEA